MGSHDRAAGRPLTDRVVVARRADGLGERLNALLNAIRLADVLEVDFRFTWPVDFMGHLEHAVVPAEEFFAPEFVAEHLIDHEGTETAFVVPRGRAPDLEALRSQLMAAERGLAAPNRWLGRFVDHRAVPGILGGYAKELSRIGFHPRIRAALDAAAEAPLHDRCAALHLRAGDIFTAHVIDWNRCTPKVMSAPIARELAERYAADGLEVVLFGQDRELIQQLRATTGAIDATTMRPSEDRPYAAMFDVALMSRCDPIVGGNSGFVRLAAITAGKAVTSFPTLVTDLVGTTRRDVAAHGSAYSPAQRAFAWWEAYFLQRGELEPDEAIELVTNAQRADPTNPHLRLRLAGLLHREGRHAESDAVLDDALASDAADHLETLRSVLAYSSIRPGLVTMAAGSMQHDHAEIAVDLDRAADRGPGPASVFRAALRAAAGDRFGAEADLRAFLEHLGRWPDRDGAERLARLAAATVEYRSAHPCGPRTA